jgi:hypothetical protein
MGAGLETKEGVSRSELTIDTALRVRRTVTSLQGHLKAALAAKE